MAGGTKINIILGSHAHVPSGAPDKEFEKAYENKLRPFVCILYKYPKIQAVLHYSGPLLNWIERNHPEFFMLIEDMINRKQVEIIGGGFYEPMFPLVPVQDRIDQIEFMTTYLRKSFGKRPSGCWIPAFAWEQQLVGALAASGMNYTFLSQKQFVKAGVSGHGLFYPCISEDQGKLVTIFPVSGFLEAELTVKNVTLVFDELRNNRDFISDTGDEIVAAIFPETPPVPRDVLAMAGEGSVPAGFSSAEYGWNLFFEELSLSEAVVETALPGKLVKSCKGLKRTSFPNSSGLEDNYLPRNFIIEHPEANGIYAKMMFINMLITQIKGDKSRKRSSREELWKSQDSSLYTPLPKGAGGHELLKSAYHALLSAERLSREKGKFASSLLKYDFDLDGVEEFLFQDTKINCYIQPAGAGIFELDYMPKAWNYLSCASGPQGLRRTAFADIILPENVNIEELEKGFFGDKRQCFSEQYETVNKSADKAVFRLKAVQGQPFGNIAIEKSFSLKKGVFTAAYEIRNTGKTDLTFSFVSEINFSFAGDGEELVRFFISDGSEKDKPAPKISPDNIGALKIFDLKNEVQILLSSKKTFELCLVPAQLNSFKATRILPLFRISLKSAETWSNEFSLKFSHYTPTGRHEE